MGGAEADRRLEIGAHPHAEEAEAVAPGDLAQQREMRRRLLVNRRHAHQPDDRQAESVAAFDDKRSASAGMIPAFCGSSPVLTSIKQGGRRPLRSISLASDVRQPRPVDALDHVEERDRVRDLVGLQWSDQVQGEIGKFLAQLRVFCLRLLHTVLAEDAMAGRQRLAHGRRRMGLADRDERHALRRAYHSPARPLRSGSRTVREIGCDNPFHSSSIPGKDRSMSYLLHYRLPVALRASLSLTLAACAANPAAEQTGVQQAAQPGMTDAQEAAPSPPEEIDTEATIWTVLGLAKKGIGQGAWTARPAQR